MGAINAERHKELIKEASQRGYDILLDTKSQQSALPGSYSASHAKLPWGLDRPHVIADFSGSSGKVFAQLISDYAIEHGYNQVLSPTHILLGADDPWFEVDVKIAVEVRRHLPREIQLIYPLSVPIAAFREERTATVLADRLASLDIDALWLRIENFGADASGQKAVAYIRSAACFEKLGVPIIADHVAGVVGMSLLAFGVAGGIAHGMMTHEGFKVSSWRRPPVQDGRNGGLAPRVYIPGLDMLVPKEKAQRLIEFSTQTRGHFGCQDPTCCPKGTKDTLRNPARHYLRQRAREVERLGGIPSSLRMGDFLERNVRRSSDAVASAAALSIDNELAVALGKRQKTLAGLRMALSSLAETFEPPQRNMLPSSRDERK